MGIGPKYWGSSMWNAIGAIALAYPETPTLKEQLDITIFLNSLQNVLPCEICREHYKENLEKYPLSHAVSSQSNLIKWIIDIRNTINEQKGKKIYSYVEGENEIRKNLFGNAITKTHVLLGLSITILVFWYLRRFLF